MISFDLSKLNYETSFIELLVQVDETKKKITTEIVHSKVSHSEVHFKIYIFAYSALNFCASRFLKFSWNCGLI